jgi:hypothetical protein
LTQIIHLLQRLLGAPAHAAWCRATHNPNGMYANARNLRRAKVILAGEESAEAISRERRVRIETG